MKLKGGLPVAVRHKTRILLSFEFSDLKLKIHEYKKTITTHEYFFYFFDQDKSKIQTPEHREQAKQSQSIPTFN